MRIFFSFLRRFHGRGHAPRALPTSPSQLLLLQPPDHSSLRSLCVRGLLKEALLEMALLGAHVDFPAYDALVTACVDRRALREGQRVHAHMIKALYLPSVYLATRLLVMYMKCDAPDDARQVFESMHETNIVSWTAMMSGYSQRASHAQALQLFVRMLGTVEDKKLEKQFNEANMKLVHLKKSTRITMHDG